MPQTAPSPRAGALTLLAACLCALSACSETSAPPAPLVMALDLRPPTARQGEVVSVSGWGFGVQGEEDGLWLSGRRLEVSDWSEELISFQVPYDELGARAVVIRARGRVTSPLNLLVLSSRDPDPSDEGGGSVEVGGEAGAQAGASAGGESGVEAGGGSGAEAEAGSTSGSEAGAGVTP